jgi:hypothetical protein
MDNKIFDVSKPGKAAPSPISRPIIVGQGSATPDTSLTGDNSSIETMAAEPTNTPIRVSMADEEHQVDVVSGSAGTDMPSHDSEQSAVEAPAGLRTQTPGQLFHSSEGATIPPHEMEELPKPNEENTGGAGANFTPLTTLVPDAGKKEEVSEYGGHHIDSLPENHAGDPDWHEASPMPTARGAGPRRSKSKMLLWLFVIILVAVAAVYLAIDAGLIKSDVKLPFHIFNKQKTSAVAPSPAPKANTSNSISQPPAQSAIPEGFTKYEAKDAGLSFAYPTAWGTPALTKDPGFSKRGGTNKTDGTHAFLVNFATNKDVQVALTSSKYLPESRPANGTAWYYYDYLQWCTGTNDNKLFYKQTLHFATDTSKVDTPATVTCDQGPIADATKLDDATIVQNKTSINSLPQAQSFDSVDLYTKNLASNKDYPVLRVKDVTMKNATDIKKLLDTLNVSSSSSSTSSGATSTTP